MTITTHGTGAYRAAKPNEFVSSRAQFDDLQRQLSTGKRSETYGDLGIQRRNSLDLNAKVASIDSWLQGVKLAEVNLSLSVQAVENFATLTNETKNDVRSNSYTPSASGRSAPQVLAEEKFKQTLDMLNTDVNGRYLFSGRTSDVQPTAGFTEMVEGDGAGRAGLKQLIVERKAADLGLAQLGRLTVGGGATSATIAEEATVHPYGFKLTGISPSSASLITALNSGPPSDLSVTVAAQPTVGETLTINLTLPDGTSETIELTARAAGTQGSPSSTFEIGPDLGSTTVNLQNAMTEALRKEGQTTLSAASALAASNSFFAGSVSNPPVRVPGPFFETATAAPAPSGLDNTVIWYRGDDAAEWLSPSRMTTTVQVDKNQTVNVGARANEETFRVGLANFAALAVETFDALNNNSQARYEALTDRVREALGFGGAVQKPSEIITEFGTAQNAIAAAKERHEATKNYLGTTLAGIENVTTEEVAVQILAIQNRLQASYQTTSILSQLSLTNYL